MLIPKATSGKKLTKCRESVFKQNVFSYAWKCQSIISWIAWGRLFQALLGPASENSIRQTSSLLSNSSTCKFRAWYFTAKFHYFQIPHSSRNYTLLHHFVICLLSLSQFRVSIRYSLPTVRSSVLHAICSFSTRTRRIMSRCYSPPFLAVLLLSGDIELNPGPSNFCLCTLNVRSILHHLHSAALSDIIETHHPDLFCLTETWIKSTTTPAELAHCTPPNYTFMSFPRNSANHSSYWRRHWLPHSRTFYTVTLLTS